MDEDGRNRQGVGDVAGVLAAGAAEAIERIARDVVAPRNRNRLDRLGHLGDRNGEKSVGDRLRLPPVADVARERRKSARARLAASSGSSPRRAEHFREEIGDQLARHQVGVGDRERTAAAISRGPGSAPAEAGPTRKRAPSKRGSSRRPRRRYGSSSSARACARLRLRSRRRARTRRRNGRRRSRCRPCRSR